MRRSLTLFESKLPWFEWIITEHIRLGAERRVAFWLRCPRATCGEIFGVTSEGIGKSRFLTRPCPNCFACAQLPMKLSPGSPFG
jgi:hypothetical protein